MEKYHTSGFVQLTCCCACVGARTAR